MKSKINCAECGRYLLGLELGPNLRQLISIDVVKGVPINIDEGTITCPSCGAVTPPNQSIIDNADIIHSAYQRQPRAH